MKSLMLSLGTLFLMVVNLEFAAAQTTSTNNAAECAKMCAKATANCNPADCAKICPMKPNCNPADCQKVCNPASCQKTDAKTAAVVNPANVEAINVLLVSGKKETSKTSCCSKAASASTTSCASEAKATKIASSN